MSAHVLWTWCSPFALNQRRWARLYADPSVFEDISRDAIFNIQKFYRFYESTSCFHGFQHIWVSGFIARCGPLPQLMETNKTDKQMDEKLKSAVKPVFICDSAAVATAGGQHTVSFMAVTLMIRRGFQTLSVLKVLRFLSVCAHAELQNNAVLFNCVKSLVWSPGRQIYYT